MEAGRAGGALAGGMNSAQREKEVPAALSRLARAIDSAESALDLLNDKISPVLSAVPPQPVNAEKVGRRADSSKVANAVTELAERVQRVADAATEIAGRVEV